MSKYYFNLYVYAIAIFALYTLQYNDLKSFLGFRPYAGIRYNTFFVWNNQTKFNKFLIKTLLLSYPHVFLRILLVSLCNFSIF